MTSLYDIIKQESENKNRPLKVICDWDEVIQPLKAGSFSSGGSISISLEGKEEKEAIEKYLQMRKAMKNSREEHDKTKDLLLALKEDLISELIIISSYRSGKAHALERKNRIIENKREKMLKTFGNFPQTKIELTKVGKNEKGKYRPHRWQRIMEILPDFDIFIDDNKNIVNESIKALADKPEKIYVLPDYKDCRSVQGPNVYHVKATVSDLKDEDFKKAAEEYKAKKEQNGAGIVLLGLGIY
ncbi:2269_t:CDS:2 [Entrophospora sp. SA101]|nr:2269_t:CDS:2 [Entrophospora sp. SA101]